jgi:thioredoxin 1
MSTVKAVTDGTFGRDVLRSTRPVLVEFWAQWCPPCRQLAPVLDQLAAEQDGTLDVVKINSDENPQTVLRYQIMQVPTLALFSGGELVKQVIGARSKSALLRDFAEFTEPAAATRS